MVSEALLWRAASPRLEMTHRRADIPAGGHTIAHTVALKELTAVFLSAAPNHLKIHTKLAWKRIWRMILSFILSTRQLRPKGPKGWPKVKQPRSGYHKSEPVLQILTVPRDSAVATAEETQPK